MLVRGSNIRWAESAVRRFRKIMGCGSRRGTTVDIAALNFRPRLALPAQDQPQRLRDLMSHGWTSLRAGNARLPARMRRSGQVELRHADRGSPSANATVLAPSGHSTLSLLARARSGRHLISFRASSGAWLLQQEAPRAEGLFHGPEIEHRRSTGARRPQTLRFAKTRAHMLWGRAYRSAQPDGVICTTPAKPLFNPRSRAVSAVLARAGRVHRRR